tara:strand:- start:335 stop:796 length:462 start_codon:yes stop_codon:yes gene_type:complete
MQTVDSNQRQLDIHEIIIMAVKNLEGDKPIQNILMAIYEETSMDGCEVVNIGNTVFIGHRGKDKNKTKMVGRPLNVDTGRNYIKNMLRYIAYIQEQGITHYTSQFKEDTLLPAMRVMEKRLQDTDTEFSVVPTKNNNYVVLIKIGKDVLNERF